MKKFREPLLDLGPAEGIIVFSNSDNALVHELNIVVKQGNEAIRRGYPDPASAFRLFQRQTELRIKLQGHFHAATLRSRLLEAKCLVESIPSKLEKGLALYEEVYLLQKTHLGEAHPSTLYSQCQLAILLYHCACDRVKAMKLLQDCYEKQLTFLGPDHNNTLYTQFIVAPLYSREVSTNHLAIPLQVDLVERNKRLCGKFDPITIESVETLVNLYGQNDRHEEAIYLLEDYLQNLPIMCDNDPTILLRILQAEYDQYFFQNTTSEENPMKSRFYKYYEELRDVLGRDHDSIVKMQKNLLKRFNELGYKLQSIMMYERLLESFELKLMKGGRDDDVHDNTIKRELAIITLELGNAYFYLNKYDKAELYYRSHVSTWSSYENVEVLHKLIVSLQKQQKYRDAYSLCRNCHQICVYHKEREVEECTAEKFKALMNELAVQICVGYLPLCFLIVTALAICYYYVPVCLQSNVQESSPRTSGL